MLLTPSPSNPLATLGQNLARAVYAAESGNDAAWLAEITAQRDAAFAADSSDCVRRSYASARARLLSVFSKPRAPAPMPVPARSHSTGCPCCVGPRANN